MTRAALIVAVVIACAVGASGQQPLATTQGRPPTGLILGRVVDAASAKPVSGIILTIRDMSFETAGMGRPGPPRITISDTQGRFVFRALAKGSYQIVATIGGNGFSPSGFLVTGFGQPSGPYLEGGFGQRRPRGPLQSIDFNDGDRLNDVVFRMWQGGAVEGRVYDEAGEPLVGLAVAAVQRSTDGSLLTGPSVKTDDRGWYRLGTLTPGEYLVVVPHTQVLMPLEAIDAALAAPQPNVVSSRFTGNGATSPATSGVRVGDSVLAPPAGYVMNSLAPPTQSGRMFTYQTTFYPAAQTVARATPIVVRSAENRTGLDIRLQPVTVTEVSGTLVDDGGPVAEFGVHLLPADPGDGSSVLEVATTATNSRGEFVFPMVPPGQYTIYAFKPAASPLSGAPTGGVPPPEPATISARPGASAEQSVAVGADAVQGLALRMRRGAQLNGRVEFVGGNPPPGDAITKLVVTVTPVRPMFRTTSPSTSGLLNSNGEFSVRGVPPGRAILRVPDVAPWTMQTVRMAGQDVTDVPIAMASDSELSNITIVYTNQPAEVSGTVRGETAGAEGQAIVLMFPTARARWPDARASTKVFRAARTTKTGAFRVPNAIPGEYFVIAVPDERAGDWPDQKFLTALGARATTVRVDEHQRLTVALTVVDIK